LNLPAIQIVQALMAPTQILLIIPFVRLGEWILRVPPQPRIDRESTRNSRARGAGYAIVAPLGHDSACGIRVDLGRAHCRFIIL